MPDSNLTLTEAVDMLMKYAEPIVVPSYNKRRGRRKYIAYIPNATGFTKKGSRVSIRATGSNPENAFIALADRLSCCHQLRISNGYDPGDVGYERDDSGELVFRHNSINQ